jgi:hypothetical protein
MSLLGAFLTSAMRVLLVQAVRLGLVGEDALENKGLVHQEGSMAQVHA